MVKLHFSPSHCFYQALLVATLCLLWPHMRALAINSNSSYPTSSAASSAMTKSPLQNQAAQVRLGIRITPFAARPLVASSSMNIPARSPRHRTLQRTLRARIDKPNHFIIGSYHIETIPLQWIRKTQSYTLRLSLNQKLGTPRGRQIEKHIGYLDVRGTLKPDKRQRLYLLMGAASHTFVNEYREPVLKVVAGYGKVLSSIPAPLPVSSASHLPPSFTPRRSMQNLPKLITPQALQSSRAASPQAIPPQRYQGQGRGQGQQRQRPSYPTQSNNSKQPPQQQQRYPATQQRQHQLATPPRYAPQPSSLSSPSSTQQPPARATQPRTSPYQQPQRQQQRQQVPQQQPSHRGP